MPPQNKPFWQSKALWLNFGLFVLASVPQAQNYIATHPALYAEVTAVSNFLIRLLTVNGIGKA